MASLASRRSATGSLRRVIFGDEHDEFRASVRGFLQREGAPHAAEWERAGMIDRGFWIKAATQGFVGFAAPEEYGGAGVSDFRFNAILDEEVVYTGTVTDAFSLTNDIVLPYLTRADDTRAAPALAAGGHQRRAGVRDRDVRAWRRI